MSKSHRDHRRRTSGRRSRSKRKVPDQLENDLRFERMLDRASYGTGISGPAILYHYTDWHAANQFLSSQVFRATAHDCTDDVEELRFADDAILTSARKIENSLVDGVPRQVFTRFIEDYARRRIGASHRTYLACFSRRRDDQWETVTAVGKPPSHRRSCSSPSLTESHPPPPS